MDINGTCFNVDGKINLNDLSFEDEYGNTEVKVSLLSSLGDVVHGSTFVQEKLNENLFIEDKIDTIEFCGFCTDICVISNVLMIKALLPEINIIVNSELCAGVTPEKHEAALEVMRSCQIEVI